MKYKNNDKLMIKKYKEFINENWQDIVKDFILPVGTVTFLTLFFRNLIQDRRNKKYKNVFLNDIFPNLKLGRITMTEDADFILIDIPEYEIEIDKNKKSIWFLNKKTGTLNLPWKQEEREDGGINIDVARAQMRYPLKLNSTEFDELIKLLRDSKTNEEADYRNVTGNGTMGNPSDQNAGPSFNKGPDSATYHRPSVIGVTTDDIKDPYFAARRNQKRTRIKKNQKVEKNRKNKAKYLDDLEKDSQNKINESIEEKEKELEKIKKILPNAYTIVIAKIGDKPFLMEIVCDANDYVALGDDKASFAGNAFNILQDLDDIIVDLLNVHAKNIEVGNINIDSWERDGEITLMADTLYFDNVQRHILLSEGDYEPDPFWIITPDELDCSEDIKERDPNKPVDPNDPYNEERWSDESDGKGNKWVAWWD